MPTRILIAALATTAIIVGGAAFAADQQNSGAAATTPPPGHSAVVKDFGKLSADGVRAYQDLTLARLAIFDGRVSDAKKYVADADQGFTKAKTADSVFQEAEASIRTHSVTNGKAASASGDKMASNEKEAGNEPQATASDAKTTGTDVNKPIAWLPVDGTVTINQDYTMQPAKVKAVAEANKSLEKGDRKGAMDKLKLAEVDTTVTLAVVPLQQTITDVGEAQQLIDSGKYYEGSQKLRAVQDATVFTVADIPAVPAGGNNMPQKGAAAATH